MAHTGFRHFCPRVASFVVFCLICAFARQGGTDPETEYVPRTGFVTLQFDDSHGIHFSHVYPLLEAYGFKGTFACVTSTSDLGIEHAPWKMQIIYEHGHEIQDHTTAHDYRWATHVDTLDDGVRDWIEWTFADSVGWDSLCERSLFILDSLEIDVIGWNHPGGGTGCSPDHPTWDWLGAVNDTMYRVIGRRYPYAVDYGVSPRTAHLNLRGHNRPDRFPFFNTPHVTFDRLGVDEIKTGMADAVASGLWYLAIGHVQTLGEVDKLDSLLEWLDGTDIEVLKCWQGWQRIEFGFADPSANQMPQAPMLADLDGNNKPDGFTGACARDTLTPPPVVDVGCMQVFGEVDSYCYGPELGTNSVSMWLRSAVGGPASIRVILVRFDFDGECLGYTNTLVQASTEWAKADSTTHANFLVEIDDEVDRVLVRLKATEGDTLVVAYPEFIMVCQSGVDVPVEDLSVDLTPFVRPNPIRRGMPLQIETRGRVEIYDVVGRRLNRYAPNQSQGYVTIDTSPLAGGVYFIDVTGSGKGRVKVVVY